MAHTSPRLQERVVGRHERRRLKATTPGKRRWRRGEGRGAVAGKARKKTPGKKSPPGTAGQEGKQVQRNAANARERARMRVLSKAFSRLKTTLPWVPPDTKLSKLDTLRLASSYIAHLRQILASDKYENGYLHPVNLPPVP
ncbi:transcription factor 21-like [Erythrolamprus reginae]|uniref:transcription factor 21-like n=1 Tax=Erythrolamprus reginae TaxID=121349 RepID=UPI00396CA220